MGFFRLKRTWLAAAGACVVILSLLGVRWCESNLRVRKGPPENAPVLPWPNARAVQITSRDGLTLHGWLLRPPSETFNYVVVLHGLGGGRTSLANLDRLFLDHQYAVLAPDNRGLGESDGDIVTYGAWEAGDVHRWMDWLVRSEHPRNVFGLGESLGGEVLLQALAVEPRFSAVVAESPFADFEQVAEERLTTRLPAPAAHAIVWSGCLYAQLRYGVDLRAASPMRALRDVTTPVLLIHGLDDRRTPARHSQILASVNPEHTSLWLVPGAGHAAAFAAAPDEFQRRVLGWFAGHERRPEP